MLTLAGLSHPGLVTVYDVGDEDGRAYFVMQLIEGDTLAQPDRAEGADRIEGGRERHHAGRREPALDSVASLRTMQMGPEEVLLAASVQFRRGMPIDEVYRVFGVL